jgi:Glycosyl hydrolase family 76
MEPDTTPMASSDGDSGAVRRRGLRRRLVRGAALLALIPVSVGVGAWKAETIKHAAGVASGGLAAPRQALADAPAAPLNIPPPADSDLTGASQRSLAAAANNAARELAGSGDRSVVSWQPSTGLWTRRYHPRGMGSDWRAPQWWQSALALTTLIRYLQQSHDTQPAYQQVITSADQLNINLPGTLEPHDFINEFMDDTAWWAIAWADAARYELTVRHDIADARRYLALAETEARYIYRQPRPCHTQGIEWQADYPPDTITNEEFVALAAQLARLRQTPGPLYDMGRADMWLGDAEQILAWLEHSGLVNMTAGTVRDHYNGRCQVSGGTITYTEGEMAEALTRMGLATGDAAYYGQAAVFLNRVLDPWLGSLGDGVLQQPCEAEAGMCVDEGHGYDAASYKGLFVAAVADWTQATGAVTYDSFLLAQGRAVIANAASDGARPSHCQTPHACQIDFYWARRVAPAQLPVQLTPGSQESGLAALTGALVAARGDS